MICAGKPHSIGRLVFRLLNDDHQIGQYDHNHLRITRVIKSLRLLVSDEVADQFGSAILDFVGGNISLLANEGNTG